MTVSVSAWAPGLALATDSERATVTASEKGPARTRPTAPAAASGRA